jgi:hypothetical protein
VIDMLVETVARMEKKQEEQQRLIERIMTTQQGSSSSSLSSPLFPSLSSLSSSSSTITIPPLTTGNLNTIDGFTTAQENNKRQRTDENIVLWEQTIEVCDKEKGNIQIL